MVEIMMEKVICKGDTTTSRGVVKWRDMELMTEEKQEKVGSNWFYCKFELGGTSVVMGELWSLSLSWRRLSCLETVNTSPLFTQTAVREEIRC